MRKAKPGRSRRVAPAPPASPHWIDVLTNAYRDVVATRSSDPLARLAKMLVDPPPLWLGFDAWSDSAAAYVKEHKFDELIQESLDKAGIVPSVPQPDDVLERLSTQLLSTTAGDEQLRQHPWKLARSAARHISSAPQDEAPAAAAPAAKPSLTRKSSSRDQKQVEGDASAEALRKALADQQKQTQDLRAEVIRLRAQADAAGAKPKGKAS
tara:strand:+ start:414 stop:1043 length:630 start_codon:yes stop_codon:yes gene_type:complete